MKSWSKLAIFIALAAFACGAACYFATKLAHRHSRMDPAEYHDWVHKQVRLTEEQDAMLHEMEGKFATKRDRLTNSIRESNRELAEALRKDKADSPRVREVINKIHQAQGELQSVVIQHVFEMKPLLSPEQYDRLIEFTAAVLSSASESK